MDTSEWSFASILTGAIATHPSYLRDATNIFSLRLNPETGRHGNPVPTRMVGRYFLLSAFPSRYRARYYEVVEGGRKPAIVPEEQNGQSISVNGSMFTIVGIGNSIVYLESNQRGSTRSEIEKDEAYVVDEIHVISNFTVMGYRRDGESIDKYRARMVSA